MHEEQHKLQLATDVRCEELTRATRCNNPEDTILYKKAVYYRLQEILNVSLNSKGTRSVIDILTCKEIYTIRRELKNLKFLSRVSVYCYPNIVRISFVYREMALQVFLGLRSICSPRRALLLLGA
jgi:hypothetical protein